MDMVCTSYLDITAYSVAEADFIITATNYRMMSVFITFTKTSQTMKMNIDICRHSFVLLRRLLSDLRQGVPVHDRRLKRMQAELEYVIKEYYTGSLALKPREDREFCMDDLLWHKKHYIRRSKYK